MTELFPASAPRDERARLFDDVVRALSMVLDFDEGTKLFHAWRVALLSVRLGQRLGMPGREMLFFGGLLHDIGGMGLDDHVLHSVRRGSFESAARAHAAEGARIVRPFSLLAPIAPMLADHHERVDGTGFPNAKKGGEISAAASVVSAADFLEVVLRGGDPLQRLQLAIERASNLRGKAWPEPIGDAVLELLQERPEELLELLDEEKLRAQMESVRFSPPGIERFTKVEILGQLLWVFARVIDAKNSYTLGHSYRVTLLARAVVRELGPGAVDDWDLVWAGLLHDVGMVGVPRSIARRQKPLTQEDWQIIRRHPLDTEAIISSIEELRPLARAAAAHHEHYDGSGYPWGLKGEEIPLLGRILAFADAYDAWRSERPHRRGMGHSETMAALRSKVGQGLDPHLAGPALEALESVGQSWPWGREAADFRGFFEADVADLTAVLPRRGQSRVVGPSGPRGAVLLEVAPWTAIELGPDLALERGQRELAALLKAEPRGSDLGSLLELASARRLLEWMASSETATLSTVIFTADGRPLEVAGLRRPKGRAELLLRAADDRLQTIQQLALYYRSFLSGAEAAFFTTLDGSVVEANRTFLELYQWGLDALEGRPPPIFPAQGPSFVALCERALAAEGGYQGEVVTSRRDGSQIPTLFSLVAVRDATGALLGFVGRAVDISERKQLEAQLEEKNRELEALGRLQRDLMAITSHDLKAPLAGLLSYARLIKDRVQQGQVQSVPGHVDRMAQLGDRMLRLVHDILSLRKIESGQFKLELRPTSLLELLNEMAQTHSPLAAEKGVALRVRHVGSLPSVLLDPDRIAQVLDNLISNAVRFAPPGSEVELEVEAEREHVRCTVCDRGPGVPEGQLELIFDRYNQVKRNQPGVSARAYNVGLGLTIARSVVELHGGRLWAEAREGGGCRFLMELPAHRARVETGRPLALLLDRQGAIFERLAPTLEPRTRILRAGDLAEAEQQLQDHHPAVVFVEAPLLSDSVAGWVEARVEKRGRRPLLVEVLDDGVPASGRADRALVQPVLDVEIFELLRELSRE